MVRLGRELRPRTDYILGIDCCLFRNVSVRYPWHNSDHYVFLGCLRSNRLRENTEYLWRHKQLPIRPPTTLTSKDRLFAALQRSIPNPKSQEASKNVFILAATWRIVDERVSARQYLARDQDHSQSLGQAINASLKEGRRRGTEDAGKDV